MLSHPQRKAFPYVQTALQCVPMVSGPQAPPSKARLSPLCPPFLQVFHTLLRSLPSLSSPPAARGRPGTARCDSSAGPGAGPGPAPGPSQARAARARRNLHGRPAPAPLRPLPRGLPSPPAGRPTAVPPLPSAPRGAGAAQTQPGPPLTLTHRRLPAARSTTGRDVTARGGAPGPARPAGCACASGGGSGGRREAAGPARGAR